MVTWNQYCWCISSWVFVSKVEPKVEMFQWLASRGATNVSWRYSLKAFFYFKGQAIAPSEYNHVWSYWSSCLPYWKTLLHQLLYHCAFLFSPSCFWWSHVTSRWCYSQAWRCTEARTAMPGGPKVPNTLHELTNFLCTSKLHRWKALQTHKRGSWGRVSCLSSPNNKLGVLESILWNFSFSGWTNFWTNYINALQCNNGHFTQ